MYSKIKKTILSAAVCALSLSAVYPVYGEELVGTTVIVVDETEDISPVSESDGPAQDTDVASQSPESGKENDADDKETETNKPDGKAEPQAESTNKNTEAGQTESKSESKAGSGSSGTAAPDGNYVNAGPGAVKKEEKAPEPKESSLGTFTITGYCGCDICSSGHGFTYSGTVPMPNHTLSADLTKFPLGTKLRIKDRKSVV